ncbi:MAG TPA: ribosome maturation factor RimM [Gemmatimonadales bacterium]|nr:ribosome maturation factor RimM [Gemmatimonadales bacterium]
MSGEPRHLVVGRLRKPHGLKGEFTVFPLTNDPASVFQAGRKLRRMDLAGTMVGEPVEVERSKAYHREWLIKFRGMESRDELDLWKGQFLAAPQHSLAKPADGEVYLHELEGFAVRQADGSPLGLVSGMYEMPSGLMLEVQGPKREFLLPFKREFVKQVDRENRVLVVELPEGLVDL